MKHGSILLVFALLLLISPFVSAGQTSASTGTESAGVAAVFSASAPTVCANVQPALLEPAPTDQVAITCGACSSPICQGKQVGSYCGTVQGQVYTCRVDVYVCSPKDCQCATGPRP